MVLVVATLIAVVEVGDVIHTEPLFCLLNDEDVLFVLALLLGFSLYCCTEPTLMKLNTYKRYGNLSGRGRGGPSFWFESFTVKIWKTVNKINN